MNGTTRDIQTDPYAEKPFRAKVGAILFLTAIFFLNFLARLIIAPLLPNMEHDLGMGHGEAGSLFLMISAGFFAALVGSGFLSSRIGHRRTIIVSAVTMGAVLSLTALSSSLGALRAGLVVVGAGAGLYLPSGIATITGMVRPANWGKALAIHEIAPNLSFVAAPLAAEILLRATSWRGVLVTMGLVSVLLGLAFACFNIGGERRGEAPRPETVKVLAKLPAFWIMILLFSMGIGSQVGIFAMLPLFLVAERGLDQTWANTLIAISRTTGLFMAFVAGWANDRIGPRRSLVIFLLTTGLATVFMPYAPGFWLAVMIFVQPTLASGFFPPGFAALSKIGPPAVRNVAVSLTTPLAVLIGLGAMPAGIGLMGEGGNFALGMALAGVFICLGPVLVCFLRFKD